MPDTKTHRSFTEAAREAAARARQRKRDIREHFPEQHQLAMVVVRTADPPKGFGWQIRRFGHVRPVAESLHAFLDPSDAGRSGQAVLDAMLASATAAE